LGVAVTADGRVNKLDDLERVLKETDPNKKDC
jgi:hypothetical protein